MNASRLVSLFLCLSLALPCAAFADTAPASGQKTDAPASTPKPVPDPTQDVWTTLLQNRVEELGAIDAETVALTKRLPDASRKLNAALSGIEEEYQRLMTLSRVSRGLPLELSVVQQRLARLNDNLSDVLEPLEGTLNTLKSRLSEISLLEQDSAPSKDETDISPELQAFLSDLAQTQGAAEYGSDPHQPRARSRPQAAGKHHLPDRQGCQVHSRVVAGLLSPALGQDLRRGFMA